ncbi:MAG: lipopolysaccharide heptosyltransferase II [Candidatus Aminicenantes bacterium]|nr:lipopolysaccharide heptosyltransferase II [Candidatus Aminicenantes bacterium]
MKIAVRAPNWIGDSILALPALSALHENFPDAEIWICGLDWIKDIFLPLKYVEGVIPLKNPSRMGGLLQNAKRLKKHQFDVGLLLTNSFSSALLFFLARITQRWGYDRDFRRFLLTKPVPINAGILSNHQALYYSGLLSGLGLLVSPQSPDLSLDPAVKQKANDLLVSVGIKFQNPLVVLNPGAFYGSAKRWPSSRFAELATMLQEKNLADILIVGSADELVLAQEIASQMKRPPIILSGKTTVSQLAGVLLHATLFVSNDSGPMHLANSLRVPVIAIFGPTDPRLTGPYQQPSAVVKKNADCWPCRTRECQTDHKCMESILAADVYLACERFLQ